MARHDDSYNLRKIFEEIEQALVQSMQRTLKRHELEEEKEGFKWEQWQKAKLRALRAFREENKQLFDSHDDEIKKIVDNSINNDYSRGQSLFTKAFNAIKGAAAKTFNWPEKPAVQLPEAAEDPQVEKPEENFFGINDKKVEALKETVNNDLKTAKAAALRMVDDVYRRTIYNAELHMTAGAKTLDQAVDMATKQFLQAGINCIEYKDGKRVNIASYAEMALRTASHRATLLGEGKMRYEWGIHTVVVSAHANTCTHCEKWQGMVLVDDVFSSGTLDEALEGGYYLVSFAISAGFLHPNCRHHLSTYFPGITELPKVPDGKKAVRLYEAEQKQRKLEAQIRKWKRIAAGSLDPDNVEAANDKVKMYQKQLRDHLKENPYLRRDYVREKTRDVPIVNKADAAKLQTENEEYLEKYSGVRYNEDGTVKVTDDWKDQGHVSIPKAYKPNAVIETVSNKGQQVDRTLYGSNGRMNIQIHSGDHGSPKGHPYGDHGEHYHEYTWDANGKRIDRITDELTDNMRIEHADILRKEEDE